MTAKEKAEDLIGKMFIKYEPKIEDEAGIYYFNMNYDIAKKSAMIAIDEIILSHNKGKDGIDIELFSYWQDVQIEILNL